MQNTKNTKNWVYVKNMRNTKYILFPYMQNMCRIQVCRMYAFCTHAQRTHVAYVHCAYNHYVICDVLYIQCQLHISFINYILCFNHIIVNYVMHKMYISSNIVSTLQIFLSFILFFYSLLAQHLALLVTMLNWEVDMSASGCSS